MSATSPHTVFVPVHPGPERLTFDTVVKAAEVRRAIEEAIAAGRIPPVEFVGARPVDRDDLTRIHDRSYVEAVLTGRPEGLAGSNGIGWDPHLFAIAAGSAGAIRDAALHAIATGGFGGALSTGLHHARRGRGNGYCTFNGLVLAAQAAIDAGARRVLILDVDAHCGGGTASLIEDMAGVEQLDVSLIGFDTYTSVPGCRLVMTQPEDYLATLADELDRVVDPTGIDLVIHNAGMDVHESAGGPDGMTTPVVATRERMVFAWAARHGLPVAWTLAGGYTSSGFDLADVAELHLLTPIAALAADRVRN
jgi:acetoin utilization deacetylase AcuC-like enzyme